MKIINILSIAMLMAIGLSAQSSVERAFNASGLTTLKGDFTWGDVTITNWNENRVEITGSISINDGESDDAFRIETEQSGGTLSITTYIENIDDLPKMVTVIHEGQKYYFKKEGDYKQQIEKLKKDLGADNFNTYSTGVSTEIKLTIKAPAGMKLELESTYGDIELDKCANEMDVQNTYGHINAVFKANGRLPSAKLISTYSFVDVSVPNNAGLDVELHTNYGSLFTDLDIAIDKSASKEKAFFNKVVGKVNNGGSSLKMKATYNNVYLRKI